MEKNRFYLTATVSGDVVLFREMVDGKIMNRKMKWKPTIYLGCKPEEATHKSLYGQSAMAIQPGSIRETKDFYKTHKDIGNLEIFGQLNYTLQFLNEYPMGTPDFTIVPVTSIDIETKVPEDGFPTPAKAEAEIVLITCIDKVTEKVTTFGSKPYDGDDTDYKFYKNETELLLGFLSHWEQNYPVILTGWHIVGFDVGYIANRILKILGESAVNRLSPWGKVTIRPNRIDEDMLDVDISGIEILDYLDLMKKYTYGGRTSWKLGSVAEEELGTTKLDHSEFKSFNEFMEKDWDKFVRYNIKDAKLVLMLDNKMKLIDLAMTIAYKAKVNYSDVYSPVKTWDAILHNALIADKIVLPQRKSTGFSSGSIMGGYVKDPVIGMSYMGSSIDATSLYPSIMRLLNLSPETYRGMIPSDIDSILNGKKFENLVKDNIAVGANGTTFDKTEIGVIPKLIKKYMSDRRVAKNEMLKLESEYEVSKDKGLLPKIAALNNLQMAIKILLNSLYGSMVNEGFRFFDKDIAEAITSTGQLYLRSIEDNINERTAKLFNIPDLKIHIYTDTDSCYFTLQKVIEKYANNLPIDKKIKAIEKLTKEKIVPIVNDICEEMNQVLNIFEPSISFKLEMAFDKAIFVAKKKYVARVYSSEGVTYSEPKIKTVGLEMVRSSTPELVREKLVEVIDYIFNSTEEKLQSFIEEVREEFKTCEVEKISRPIGVSNLEVSTHTPIHVRAALTYNEEIRKKKLEGIFPILKSGDKTQYIYLKLPNPVKQNVIGWSIDDKLPTEFNLTKFIDRDLQFEKTFLQSTKIILDAIKWSPVKIDTLDDFFA